MRRFLLAMLLGCCAMQVSAQAFDDADKTSIKLGVRRDFLTAVSGVCGRLFPEHAPQYQRAVQVWSKGNEAGLKQADTLMITRSSREDAQAMRPLLDEEKRTLQAWQTGKLGISQQKAPSIADCDKLYASLGTLP
jgi:hypothetical protein